MKQFIWMLCGIFLSGLLLGTLSACGADQFGTCVITTGRDEPEPGETEAPPETAGDNAALPDEDPDAARRLAYGKALRDMYLSGVLPDGTALERVTDLGPQEGNQFALCDVNGDGEEELIVYWTSGSMAGMQGLVYGYDGGELRLELSEFPALTFYAGGAVTADWSHSQGWAGRFWPYSLYRYSRETGEYVQIGAVDAWDSSCTEEDETLAAAFPREADADGDGLVYYILTGEWYMRDRTAPDGSLYRLWDTDPVDRAELDAWMDSYTDGSEIVSVPFQDLTEENIAALGAPKPDAAGPAPAG